MSRHGLIHGGIHVHDSIPNHPIMLFSPPPSQLADLKLSG